MEKATTEGVETEKKNFELLSTKSLFAVLMLINQILNFPISHKSRILNLETSHILTP